MASLGWEKEKDKGRIEEKDINTYVYSCANNYISLITEFVINCEELIEEPLDPRYSLEEQLQQQPKPSALAQVFHGIWPLLKSTMHDFSQLEKLMENVTRLI